MGKSPNSSGGLDTPTTVAVGIQPVRVRMIPNNPTMSAIFVIQTALKTQ
ncbi:MAG: hypothetical protein ACRCXC_08530 [Legionella sp.]